jgi:hypothetical protein
VRTEYYVIDAAPPTRSTGGSRLSADWLDWRLSAD